MCSTPAPRSAPTWDGRLRMCCPTPPRTRRFRRDWPCRAGHGTASRPGRPRRDQARYAPWMTGPAVRDLVTLKTPRLILRQWQPTDLDRYVELFADPEVARYIFRGQPARREQLTEMSGNYLRQWRDLRLGPFAAIDRASGAWIGQIGLNHLAYWPGPEKVEVGWELHRRWWGHGLATEGGRAALRFGFEERGLRRVISTAARRQPRLPARHGKDRADLPGNPRHRRSRDRLVRDRQHRLKTAPDPGNRDGLLPVQDMRPGAAGAGQPGRDRGRGGSRRW